jgi:hypothetical protein
VRLVLTGLLCSALATSACGEPPALGDVVALEIQRIEHPAPRVGEACRVSVRGDPAAAVLIRALERCRGPEMAKFVAHYHMRAVRPDGGGETVLVNGRFVKVNGVAFACRDDVEALAAAAAIAKP